MPAVATIPGLSELLAWPTEHLTEAAGSWETVAERSYGVANRVWRDALSVDWHGEAADALRTVTHADMTTTSAVADQLQAAARVARSGASDLDAARSRLQYAVEDAREAGFDVGEDLSVADRTSGGSAALRAARQAEAETLAGDIRQRATKLIGLDEQVATKITAAVDGISQSFPPNNRVQAVDYHRWKEDPTPPPEPPEPEPEPPWRHLPPPKNWEDVRKAWLKLRHGEHKTVRELDTPEEIRDFYEWLAKGAVSDLPPRKDFSGKKLEDGTEIQFRPESGSSGPAVDVIPPGASRRKVHLPLPFVNDYPGLPGLDGDLPIEPPLPLPNGHPLPQALPPTQFDDPADLPPWLKDPSPPGFQVSPAQPPPAFDWDVPDPPPQPAQQQGTPLQGGSSWLPHIGHDLSDAGEKGLAWLMVGGVLIGSLWGIGQQGEEVPAP